MLTTHAPDGSTAGTNRADRRFLHESGQSVCSRGGSRVGKKLASGAGPRAPSGGIAKPDLSARPPRKLLPALHLGLPTLTLAPVALSSFQKELSDRARLAGVQDMFPLAQHLARSVLDVRAATRTEVEEALQGAQKRGLSSFIGWAGQELDQWASDQCKALGLPDSMANTHWHVDLGSNELRLYCSYARLVSAAWSRKASSMHQKAFRQALVESRLFHTFAEDCMDMAYCWQDILPSRIATKEALEDGDIEAIWNSALEQGELDDLGDDEESETHIWGIGNRSDFEKTLSIWHGAQREALETGDDAESNNRLAAITEMIGRVSAVSRPLFDRLFTSDCFESDEHLYMDLGTFVSFGPLGDDLMDKLLSTFDDGSGEVPGGMFDYSEVCVGDVLLYARLLSGVMNLIEEEEHQQ